jgi:hypothetical protein
MRSLPALLASVMVLSLSACATSGPQVRVEPLTQRHYAATNLVEMLAGPPSKPYEQIARLHVQGSGAESPAQLQAALQAKAAELGADAVIVKDESTTVPPAVSYNPSGGQYSTTVGQTIPAYSAIAIRYAAPEKPNP